MRTKVFNVIIVIILCDLSFVSAIKAQSTKLNVTTTGVSPTSLAAFVARETGIFAKNGLDVQVIRATSSVSVLARVYRVSGKESSHLLGIRRFMAVGLYDLRTASNA